MENEQIRKVDINSLKMAPPFESLFSVDTETYKQTFSKVYVNIDLLGFDKTQQIIIWKGKNIVIDGHTRLRAARQKGIKEVWVIEKDFLNDDDAIQYAIHLQRDRRKLTDADIFRLVTLLDKKHPEGRPKKTASTDAVSNPSNAVAVQDYTTYVHGIAGIAGRKGDGRTVPRWHQKIPYPDDSPKTAYNLALHEIIPLVSQYSTVKEHTEPGKEGGKIHFKGDLFEGLRQFSEWSFGRSDDITATLIGTSRAKVDKCRHIIHFKKKNNQDIDIQDIKDKVLRGKLTINRACSILKNNGKHVNRKVQKLKFRDGIVVDINDQSIDSDSVKWIILGTHVKTPKVNQLIPKDSIIRPMEQRKSLRDVLASTLKGR